jgi:hypothetical protein
MLGEATGLAGNSNGHELLLANDTTTRAASDLALVQVAAGSAREGFVGAVPLDGAACSANGTFVETLAWLRRRTARTCTPRHGPHTRMKPQPTRKPKRVKEFFLASLLVRVPGKRGRHAWRREVLRARTPRALLRQIDGRKHIAYASNGVEVIRIELIDLGRTLLAPVADGAQVEPLTDLLARIAANPTGYVR